MVGRREFNSLSNSAIIHDYFLDHDDIPKIDTLKILDVVKPRWMHSVFTGHQLAVISDVRGVRAAGRSGEAVAPQPSPLVRSGTL
jgi:hypothetical protein